MMVFDLGTGKSGSCLPNVCRRECINTVKSNFFLSSYFTLYFIFIVICKPVKQHYKRRPIQGVHLNLDPALFVLAKFH